MKSAIFTGTTFHHRAEPRKHTFSYPMPMLFLSLRDLAGIQRLSNLFGYNKNRALSIHDRDYLRPGNLTIDIKVATLLADHGVAHEVEDIFLLTSPKIFGIAFNPVSFFFCFSHSKELIAVIAEVRNTFKEKHLYFLQGKEGRAMYSMHTGEREKRFYVSPFNKVDGEYDFRIKVTEREARVTINYTREGGKHFTASLQGTFEPLSKESLRKSFMSIGMNTLLILPRIIKEAMKLHYLKKLPVQPKPLVSDDCAYDLREPRLLDRIAWKLVNKYFRQFKKGRIILELPNGELHEYGDPKGSRPATMKVHDYSVFRDLILHHDIGLGDAFVERKYSTNDLTLLLKNFVQNMDVLHTKPTLISYFTTLLRSVKHFMRRNNKLGSRKNIHAHYDLSNDLFETFLDPTMTYSSALYESEEDTLEQAQIRKLDRMAELAQLSADDHVLEIGCGWGSFAIHAASKYGCKVTGITLSQNQLELARKRVHAKGLDHLIELKLIDYRDIEGRYDKIISIEMIEAVGHQYYPTFFENCERLLKEDGIMVLQAITIPDYRFEEASKGADWIQKEIFPGSTIPSLTALSKGMEQSSRFIIENVSHVGKHYARTLREWRELFFENRERILGLGYDERFIRYWQYYLCYCEAGFDSLYTGVHHIRFTRPMNESLIEKPKEHRTELRHLGGL